MVVVSFTVAELPKVRLPHAPNAAIIAALLFEPALPPAAYTYISECVAQL